MENYTKLEIELLKEVVGLWHENEPDYTEFSIGLPHDKPMSNQSKGVLSSLVKKQLVVEFEQDDEGNGVYTKVYPTVKGIVLYLQQYDSEFRIAYINRMSDLNGEQTEVRKIILKENQKLLKKLHKRLTA